MEQEATLSRLKTRSNQVGVFKIEKVFSKETFEQELLHQTMPEDGDVEMGAEESNFQVKLPGECES